MPNQAWLDTVLDLLICIERNTDKDASKNNIPTKDYDILDTIRKNFYYQLERKIIWERNEIKEIFEKSISKTVGKGDTPPWQP